MFRPDAPPLEPDRERAPVEGVKSRYPIDHDQTMDVELQLHQQFIAECVNEVGGVRSTADMTDLDERAGGRG